MQGASTPRRREYPGGNGNDDEYRRPYRDWRPPKRGRYPNQGGSPLTKEDTLIEDLLEEDILIEMEDPLEEEDSQEEDLLMEMENPLVEMEDPLMIEDLLVMEDPWTSWWTRANRSSRTPWTSETNNSINSLSNIRYICSRKYLLLCWTIHVAVGQGTRPN